MNNEKEIERILLADDSHPSMIKRIIPYRNAKKVSVRIEPKIGRNDLCPCKSGLKYKKCCIK